MPIDKTHSQTEITDQGLPGDYHIFKQGNLEVHLMPSPLFELSKEILRHPGCLAAIEQGVGGNAGEWWTKLASIAAYVDVAVDGHYNAADLERVADICLRRLRSGEYD